MKYSTDIDRNPELTQKRNLEISENVLKTILLGICGALTYRARSSRVTALPQPLPQKNRSLEASVIHEALEAIVTRCRGHGIGQASIAAVFKPQPSTQASSLLRTLARVPDSLRI